MLFRSNRNILTIVNRSIVDNNKVNHFEDTLFLYNESLANFQDYLLLSESEYVYKIINSYNSTFHKYNYDIFKFGNINISKNIYLETIDSSKFSFENNFDNDSITINLLRSENSIEYNFLLSNVISKLLSSS